MKHFKRMKEQVDVGPFLDELRSFQGDWSDWRAKTVPLHRETLSIPLREPVLSQGELYIHCERDRKTEHYAKFPQLTAFLEQFADGVHGRLSRANIVSLRSGGKVYAHIDHGAYYKNRDRYHMVLQSPSGSRMLSGGEECVWREGEVWWFDNKAMHEAHNPSDGADRIHVIFDIKPFTFWERLLRR
jgi:hypothetical protein